jgi:hypothetical protein
VRRCLGEFLDPVHELGCLCGGETRVSSDAGIGFSAHGHVRAGDRIAEDEAVHLLRVDVVRGYRRRRASFPGLLVARGIHRVDQHQAGFFVQGHPSNQVINPFGDRAPPILVRVQLAVAIEVLEGKAVDFDDVLDPRFECRRSAVVSLVSVRSHGPTVRRCSVICAGACAPPHGQR